MKINRYGNTLATMEHLLSGKRITRLEAMLLFGVSNLSSQINKIRKKGWIINSRSIPFAAAVKRVNEYAVVQPPKNLPIREIQLTEYWLSK